MSPLAHGAMCAACLGLGLTDLAWLDLHAAEMSAPPSAPREAPRAPPSPPIPAIAERAPASLTLTSATVASGDPRSRAGGASRAEPAARAVIGFALNAEDASAEDLADVDAIAAELARDPGAIAVVEGHADRSGPADFNVTLSERRAAGIARRLEEKGVAPDRLRVRGFGAARPRDEGGGEEARRRNRRVEIRVQERGEP
jgi:outer membrane protein OmpA-like peptidoglycan-associated protein